MVVEPERHIEAFMEAGGDIINVHVEAATHLHRIVQQVKGTGRLAGVCLNPATPLSAVEAILPDVDQVVVMSVNPGYAGQPFIPSALDKMRRLRRLLDELGLEVDIEVDGGVSPETAPACVAAGATALVAASAIFNDRASVAENMARLQAALAEMRA
jgi:ribulose-phosphate 3-epimerase